MKLSFNTIETLYLACVLLLIYIVTLVFQKKLAKMDLENSSKIYFSSIAIVAGLRLIHATITILETGIIDTDKLYTLYGGFYVVRNGVLSFFRILAITA